MITYHNGDLLKSGCDIICHQVNLQGVMGGGLAKQIAAKYPEVEEEYKRYLNFAGKELAYYDIVKMHSVWENLWVVNIFSQNEDFTTNYDKLKLIVKDLKNQIKKDCKLWLENHTITIGIPYKYGCGIASGDWKTVEKIWCNVFKNEQHLDLQIWRLV